MRCRRRVTGKLVSRPDEPLLLLDESLTPAVADALSLVGYRFATLAAAFGRKGVEDPEIIEWCRAQDAAWVHADDRARKEHRALLQRSGIRTVWVYRKQGRMSSREQLRILAFVLPQLFRKWEEQPRVRHYRVTAVDAYAKPGVRAVEL